MKEKNKLKKKIKELKSTSRGQAIWRLIKWAIFFFALFIFLIISSLITANRQTKIPSIPDPPIKEETPVLPKIKTLKELANTLLKSTYDYKYEINVNDELYIYNGHKDLTKEVGYKETSSGIIKYYKDETGTYQMLPNENIPLENLYENINSDYIDFEKILTILDNLEFTLNKTISPKTQIYESKDTINNYQYETDNTNLLMIKIFNDNYSYNLVFSNHEEVKK